MKIHASVNQVRISSFFFLQFAKRSEEPNPYAVIHVANTSFESQVKNATQHPIWEEAFSFLITSPHVDSLTVSVRDKKNDKELGNCTVMLKILLSEPNMTLNRPFALKQCQTRGFVTMRLSLRVSCEICLEIEAFRRAAALNFYGARTLRRRHSYPRTPT